METQPPAAATGAADPYAPPRDDEATRRELLVTETSIRVLGILLWFGGVMNLLLAAFFLLFAVPFGGDDLGGGGAGNLALTVVLYGPLGAGQIWASRGLRRFDPRVETLSVAVLVIGLLDFPLKVWPAGFPLQPTLVAPLAPSSLLFGTDFGTILSFYFLFLLLGEKGKRVLTTEYQRIVAATPHVRYQKPLWYKTPIWMWLVLIFFGVILTIAIVLAAAA